MRIAIGSDHRGFELKKLIIEKYNKDEIKWTDVGTGDTQRTDYPVYTLPVCLEILQGTADAGILICGSGVGMSIAANRFSNIYAALVWNEEVARLSKEHDNANILILPADFISNEQAFSMIHAWLNAQFKGDRYKTRLDMIDMITQEVFSPSNNNCCGC